MSAANAAARKRRTTPDPAPQVQSRPAQQGPSTPTPPAGGLTLQQVISVIDNRLIKLETFVKESSQNKQTAPSSSPLNKELEITNNDVLLQEFDRRFELLAEEISNLKDALLKLQTYTMDVNKTLMEERVRVFSELGSGSNESATFSENIFQGGNITISQETSALDLRNLAESELTAE
jgi:hypothetical protein